jgi:hypothetical protein
MEAPLKVPTFFEHPQFQTCPAHNPEAASNATPPPPAMRALDATPAVTQIPCASGGTVLLPSQAKIHAEYRSRGWDLTDVQLADQQSLHNGLANRIWGDIRCWETRCHKQ